MKTDLWWRVEDNVILKPDRVVVKRYDDRGGEVIKCDCVPSRWLPLPGKYEVYHMDNTVAVTDPKIMEIFDSVEYHLGRCYENTEKLCSRLLEEGYSATSYFGWLYMGNTLCATAHAWCVLVNPDGSKSLLDLADHFRLWMHNRLLNEMQLHGAPIEAYRSFEVSFVKYSLTLKNSDRCWQFGNCSESLYYIGAPCDPDTAQNIVSELRSAYPDHECFTGRGADDLTETQRMILQ